ncbi:MAG: response regulator [Myxococcota bacterium]
MIRTLFVDDEPDVLEALENRLRRLRRRWSMTFAVGGREALARLASEPFDVIVSDMRMPGMDGIELLSHVRSAYPHMVRIVLSGQTSKEQAFRTLSVAHQFLSKPCDAPTLVQSVERFRVLEARLASPAVRGLTGVQSLPTVPTLYAELSASLDSGASFERIGELVAKDPAVTARLLQVANSPFFGAVREVEDVRAAVAYLGTEAVRAVVLSEGLWSAVDIAATVPAFSFDAVQAHSLHAARLVSQLAPSPEVARAAFSAALLHDIGSLVLAMGNSDFYPRALAEAETSGICLEQAERWAHGVSHAEVGAALLAIWGIPYSIVEGVAYHHRPRDSQEHELGVVGVVHLADWLAHGAGSDPGALRAPLDTVFVERLGIRNQVEEWRRTLTSGEVT